MIAASDIQFVKSHFSFYELLSTTEQQLFEKEISLLTYESGFILKNTPKTCLGLTLIKSGRLRVFMMSEDGREITLYRLSSGEICILSASCILPASFDIHIVAETKVTLYTISMDFFTHFSKKNMNAENFLYRTMISRFSDIMHSVEQLLFSRVDRRLAQFLLNECAQNHTDTLQLTQEQLANYLGSAREVISRTLKSFQSKEIIVRSRGAITILDKKRLSTI